MEDREPKGINYVTFKVYKHIFQANVFEMIKVCFAFVIILYIKVYTSSTHYITMKKPIL